MRGYPYELPEDTILIIIKIKAQVAILFSLYMLHHKRHPFAVKELILHLSFVYKLFLWDLFGLPVSSKVVL